VRIPAEVARRVRDGHPWVFADALQGRSLPAAGRQVEIVDPEGRFVARAVVDGADNLALRVFARTPGLVLDRGLLERQLERCIERRRQRLDLSPISCFRLVNGDSEGIPGITVDSFGRYLVVCCYTPAVEQLVLGELIDLLASLGHHHGIYLQRRYRPPSPDKPRPGAELVWGDPAPSEVVVEEDGVRYIVDVTAPASPGLYPDMRLGRRAVARLAGGRRVLNCFSYTGAFSVIAALHGARSVVSVDASSRAHGRARRNFKENNLDPDQRAYEFVAADTFATLARMAERGRRFDLVILDPPTFSGGRGRTFTALRGYAEVVQAALGVLEEGGILCAASNAAKLSAADLDRSIGRGGNLASRELVVTERLGQPPDYPISTGFPEGSYLKFLVVRA
jgi:23S rRNA (cytosine1962-C5)-methyltransferase